MQNPIWQALNTSQSHFAIGTDRVKRFPAEVAPFVAVSSASTSEDELATVFEDGESLWLVGQAPALNKRFEILTESTILQMVCQNPILPKPIAVQEQSLTIKQVPDMMALTSLVFPGYFKSETLRMGTYVGIYCEGRLAAMAGERLRFNRYKEISAVCTHPDYLGRGYAGHLVSVLVRQSLDQGLTPFLHVGAHNERAQGVYLRMGFIRKASVSLWHVRKMRHPSAAASISSKTEIENS